MGSFLTSRHVLVGYRDIVVKLTSDSGFTVMLFLSINTAAPALTKREVYAHKKRLADIREGVALLGNVAVKSRVGRHFYL